MKKIIVFIVAMLMCVISMSSCAIAKNDPISVAIAFEDEDYIAKISVDEETVKGIADTFEIRSKGIYCVVAVTPESSSSATKLVSEAGMFIYCEDTATAKEMVEDLEDFSDSDDFKKSFDRGIIQREGKLVFVGCEDAWETYTEF